jgi:hypothetical protein
MAVAKSLDKILFLYTEHTDNTVSSVKMTEKLRPLREIRVQRASNPDFAIAMPDAGSCYFRRLMAVLY